MSTTAEEQLQQILRRLPPRYAAAAALLAGGAAQLALVNNVAELDFVATGFFGNAEGIWLDLHAAGYGLYRSTDETNEQLRERLRNVSESVTRSAILDAVDALLAPLTAVPAEMIEHFERGAVLDTAVVDFAFILDHTYLVERASSFIIIVPDFGDLTNPVYASILSEVNRLKAAGVQWALIVDGAP